MSVMPQRLSQAPLGSRAVAAQAAGLAATYTMATAIGRVIDAPPTFPLVASGVFCVVALIVLSHLHHHPFAQFGAANLVTTVRVVAVSVVVALIGESRTPMAAWTAAIGGSVSAALDGVDGWLARRSGLASEFGARYDMEIDALLILALCALAWQHEKAGVWILLAGAMRYLFVGAGYVWSWMNAPLPPSFRRKTVCVVQIVGLILAVSPVVPVPVSVIIGLLTLASLLWSFGVDVVWLWQHSE